MIDEKLLIECLNTKNEEYAVDLVISPTMTTREIIDATIQAFRKSMFKVIDAQPKVGEWIPVTELDPDHNQEVLIKLDDGFICSARFHTSNIINNCWFYNKYIGVLYCQQVIACMPLPAPYKEERGGKNG